MDLFAGIVVSDLERAVDWYSRLFGSDPAFRPNDTEAVWELAEHRFLYVEQRAEGSGSGLVTLFQEDLEPAVDGALSRGIEPTDREVYSNGVRKVVFHDPDGSEIGFGGGPEV